MLTINLVLIQVALYLASTYGLNPFSSNVTSVCVGTGSDFHCALDDSGIAYCWGTNRAGQLGLKDNINRKADGSDLEAVKFPTPVAITEIACGLKHACALTAEKRVFCWGTEEHNQVRGSNEPGSVVDPTEVLIPEPASSVAAGESVSCAILERDGSLRCWGNLVAAVALNTVGSEPHYAYFPDTDMSIYQFPPLYFNPLGPSSRAVQVGIGSQHICTLFESGVVSCFGGNAMGQLGYGDALDRGKSFAASVRPINFGENTTAVSLAVGASHSCVILDSGAVKCWGGNVVGQCGISLLERTWGDRPEHLLQWPAVDLGGHQAVGIAAHGTRTCVTLDTGDVACWGGDDELGAVPVPGEPVSVPGEPVPTPEVPAATVHMLELDGPVQALAGSAPCVILQNKLRCYTFDSSTPLWPETVLTSDRHVSAVSVGWETFACALFGDNARIKCWGENSRGALGLEDTVSRGDGAGEMGDDLPFVDLGEHAAVQISCGGEHSCVVLSSGGVKCFGRNQRGQLGYGDRRDRGGWPGSMGESLPLVDLGAGVLVRKVATGNVLSCALTTTGGVKCWGQRVQGQGPDQYVGDDAGEMGDNLPYVRLSGPAEDIAIPQSSEGGCAVVPSAPSGLECWGGVHQGSSLFEDAGVAILPGRAVQVEAGRWHVCVVLEEGGVTCFGSTVVNPGEFSGFMGTMGAEYPVTQGFWLPPGVLPPIDLGDGLIAKKVVAGDTHTCVLFTTGQVKCFGSNQYGQIGKLGVDSVGSEPFTMGSNLTFVDFGFGKTALDISAYRSTTCAVLDNHRVKCWGVTLNGEIGGRRSVTSLGNGIPYVELGVDPQCYEGHFDGGSFTCLPCEAGYYQPLRHQTRCNLCGRGEYSHEAATSCEWCVPGTQAVSQGSTTCEPCARGEFQPLEHQVRCEQCAPFTTTEHEGSISKDACVANLGYYSVQGQVVTCHPDAVCDRAGLAAESLPLKAGFWRQRNSSLEVQMCPEESYCVGGDVGRFSVDVRESTKYCATGHRGPFCSLCEPGYSLQGTLCKFCSEEDSRNARGSLVTLLGASLGVPFILGSACTALAVKWLDPKNAARGNPKSNRSLSLYKSTKPYRRILGFGAKVTKQVFAFFQVISIYLQTFGKSALQQNSIVDLLLIDPNFFRPLLEASGSCLQINHNQKLVLLTLLPIGCWVSFSVPLLIAASLKRIEWKTRQTLLQIAFGLLVAIAGLTAPGVLRIVFDSYGCDYYDDEQGSVLLRVDPSLHCSEVESNYANAMSVLYGFGTLLLFLVAIQFGTNGVPLHRLIVDSVRGKTSKEEEAEIETIGVWKIGAVLLKGGYKPEFRWFELAEHVRKLIQGPFVVLFLDGTLFQIAVCLFICFVAETWLVIVKPFSEWRLTAIAMLSQLQLALFCILCILGRAGESNESLSQWAAATVWIGPVVAMLFFLWFSSESLRSKPLEQKHAPIEQQTTVDEVRIELVSPKHSRRESSEDGGMKQQKVSTHSVQEQEHIKQDGELNENCSFKLADILPKQEESNQEIINT